jgi:hypothetical protein
MEIVEGERARLIELVPFTRNADQGIDLSRDALLDDDLR